MHNKESIKYSIIVPVKEINEYINQHKVRFLEFSRRDLELVVLPDTDVGIPENSPEIRFVQTGRVSPAVKRDIGSRISRGHYLVFLDDDAFVKESFFAVLDDFFSTNENCAVGGPGITPLDNTTKQKTSGAVYEDNLLSSDPHRYLAQGSRRLVDDWPSVNFSIPRDLFLTVGGFGQDYWPGEDTIFCRKLLQLGVEIFYEPNLIAYHNRRHSLSQHLKQASGYGLHRGHFARKFPENSRKMKYFIPTLFAIYILFTFAVLIAVKLTTLTLHSLYLSLAPLAIYIILLLNAARKTIKRHSLTTALQSLFYFPLTHLVYGVRFLYGFLTRSQFKSVLR